MTSQLQGQVGVSWEMEHGRYWGGGQGQVWVNMSGSHFESFVWRFQEAPPLQHRQTRQAPPTWAFTMETSLLPLPLLELPPACVRLLVPCGGVSDPDWQGDVGGVIPHGRSRRAESCVMTSSSPPSSRPLTPHTQTRWGWPGRGGLQHTHTHTDYRL